MSQHSSSAGVPARRTAVRSLVIVGQALAGGFNSNQRGTAMWTDVDLDFYSPHRYSPHTSPFSICDLCTTAPDLKILYNTTLTNFNAQHSDIGPRTP